jgi:hypothetical protein
MAKAPVFELAVIVPFSEVFDASPTVEGARAILAKYKRESVLLVLAKLSAALSLWFRPDYAKDNGLACDVFRGSRRVLTQTLPGNPRRLFFTRLGVLATARLALAVCADAQGAWIDQPAQAAQILKCCLMMNELAVSSEKLTGAADLVVNQLPNDNAMPHYDFRADLLRSIALFERNQELLPKRSGLVDLQKEFTAATGLTPRQFVGLCLVIGIPYRLVTAASLVSDDPGFYIERQRFANIRISEDELSAFFRTIARTATELADFLPTQGNRPLADTTVFQSWPFIRTDEERYYCLDVASLMDKTGRGLYWTLFGTTDKGTKARLGGTYGLAFETYLHHRAHRAGFSKERYMDNPMFANGDEVCDAIFIDNSDLVVCEYKSSVLRVDAKLGGRPDLILAEIDKKFVTGDEEGRKGIGQLTNSIIRILRGENLPGLPVRRWARILPVMVCLEHAMICPGMSGYLNQRFDRSTLKAISSTKIAPLIVIDVEHFEDLLADMHQYGFATLLESYYRAHMRFNADQLAAFRRRNIPFLDDKPEPSENTDVRFRHFLSELGVSLFGEPD